MLGVYMLDRRRREIGKRERRKGIPQV